MQAAFYRFYVILQFILPDAGSKVFLRSNRIKHSTFPDFGLYRISL
jgi:hypothetical protein